MDRLVKVHAHAVACRQGLATIRVLAAQRLLKDAFLLALAYMVSGAE